MPRGKARAGRLSTFSQKVADVICERIAQGESLRGICRGNDMPAASTVFKWLNDNESFSEQYARAREAQADTIFDEILEIADDTKGDYSLDAQGNEIVDHEHIQRSRLRVDARKWMAGKLRPKKYGDKVQTEISGLDGGPIAISRIERVVVDPKNGDAPTDDTED